MSVPRKDASPVTDEAHSRDPDPRTSEGVAPDPVTAPPDFDPTRRYLRVTGERPDGFVEFDFGVGDPDVFVELVLSRPAFEEFCAANQPEPMPSADATSEDGGDALDAGSWRISDATHRHI